MSSNFLGVDWNQAYGNAQNLLNWGSNPTNQLTNASWGGNTDNLALSNAPSGGDLSGLGNSGSSVWGDFKSLFDGALDQRDAGGIINQGWAMPALGAANSMFQSWMGMKQLDLAKKSLSEQKRQFNMNWDAQRNSYNNQLAERQANKIAFDPNSQDVATYMAKWGIK